MVNLTVSGMSCGHCVNAITKAIQSAYPQAHVNIDLEKKSVCIEGVEEKNNIVKLIEEEGYKVS
ncbi:MAG: heavy-metal-associated domain-containing protein [Pseudomonadota bacterium]